MLHYPDQNRLVYDTKSGSWHIIPQLNMICYFFRKKKELSLMILFKIKGNVYQACLAVNRKFKIGRFKGTRKANRNRLRSG